MRAIATCLLLLCLSCETMSDRDARLEERVVGIQRAYEQGAITEEERDKMLADAFMSARADRNREGWTDLLLQVGLIAGTALLGSGMAVPMVNTVRNRERRRRGEPI